MKKALYLWCGEFGWEVARMVAIANWSQMHYDMTVSSFPSAAGLYGDMNVKFIPHSYPNRLFGTRGVDTDQIKASIDIDDNDYDLFHIGCNTSIGHKLFKGKLKEVREDINPTKIRNQVVIHARNISESSISSIRRFVISKSKRNWRPRFNKAIEYLVSKGFRVGFVGIPGQSLYVDGLGEDWRSTDSEFTIRKVKESAFMFGQASGPFVLSVYCRTPVFTWGCSDLRLFHDKGKKGRWNPFHTQHFHPWSMNETEETLKKYRDQSSNFKVREIIRGINWMLNNCDFVG